MVFLGAEAGQPMQKREKSFGKSSVLHHINVCDVFKCVAE